MISASPASAQRVIPPVPFTAVGCAVRWLAERRPDPHNCERDHDEDRDHNLAPHGATVTTADVPMVTAIWQIGPRLRDLPISTSVSIWTRDAGHGTGTYILCARPLPCVRLDTDLRRGDTEVQSELQVDQAKLILGMG